MGKALVTTDEIIKEGEWLLSQGKTVSGYKIKSRIGRGRAERLMEEWEKYLDTKQLNSNSDSENMHTSEIDVLEPEIELLLENLVDNMSQQLKGIVISCDKKVQTMGDKKVDVVRSKFEIELDKLDSTLDVREEYIGELELENEKLIDELAKFKSIELNQFENEKTFIKLRGRLQSKSDLLAERQLRIDELIKLNNILEGTAIAIE